jgi:predicted nucleic acid-binding protein
MPAVSDASPLILFAKIGRLNLLKHLFSEIIIPIQVRDEVTKHNDESSFLIISEIENGWIRLEEAELSPEINSMGEKLGLHKGEMYALSLAMRLNIREFLADDKMARVAARMCGLRSIGCLGVVMRGYETGIITRDDAIESIQQLVKAGLWVSPEVLAEVFTAME